MSPVFLSWQDQLLHEGRTFKADLEAQANILRSDPDQQRSELNGDVSRAIIRLSLQTDRIIDIGLSMLADAPDNELIRRHPPFWHREEDSSKFERMFRILERDLDQMALAMNKDPLPEECGRIAEGLEKMAKDVAFDFGL